MKLYVKGRALKSDRNAIAVVGSKKPSPRGEVLTKKFVKKLVSKGFTIVSGFSDGVNTIAIKTALKEKGRVIAVGGCGIDILMADNDNNLIKEIIKKGVLVSPFKDGVKPSFKNYLTSNMTIASLVKWVLVIEDRKVTESASIS